MADKTASFIENVRVIANATKLSTGDIVEDTERARDEAVAASTASYNSARDSATSRDKSMDWAQKGHNNPVDYGGPGGAPRFSSYHWEVEAELLVSDPLINDGIISLLKTWSSNKIVEQLNLKSDKTHNHNTMYEPIIGLKGTAFNKDFGDTDNTVAIGNHNHNNNYEPKRTIQGTAYNKDFGTSQGQVAEGNHSHTEYEPKRDVQGTAYNKNFVTDQENPGEFEVPKGNHIHKASGISIANKSYHVIASSNVQGALENLDTQIGGIEVAEETFYTGTHSGDETFIIDAVNTPKRLDLDWATLNARNAHNNLTPAEITIDYGSTDFPQKRIEGFCVATFVFGGSDTVAISMVVNGSTYGTTIRGTGTLTIDRFVEDLDLINDINHTAKIAFNITNETSDSDLIILSRDVLWSGSPRGAVISSGTTMSHADLIDLNNADQHSIGVITGLQSALDSKAAIDGDSTINFDVKDATLPEHAVSKNQLDTKVDKTIPAATGNIATLDTSGSLADGGSTIDSLAQKNGDELQTFKVANAANDNEAVSLEQVNNIASLYAPVSHDHVMSEVTGLQGALDDKASSQHDHVVSDITNLQDALDNKYSEVSSPVTDNFVSFAAGGILQDSQIAINDFQTLQDDVATNADDIQDNYSYITNITTSNIIDSEDY